MQPPDTLEAAVVAVLPDGARVRVWTAPLPDPGPTATALSARGPWQHGVRRADDGTLLVTRTPVAPWVRLVGIDAETAALTARAAPGPGVAAAATDLAALLLVAQGGETLHRLPVEHDEAAGHVLIRVPVDLDLASGSPAALLLVGPREGTYPLRRVRNEMTMPDRATLLPWLHDDDPHDRPVLRWRWLPDGQLAVLRPPRPEARPEARSETRDEAGGDD